MQNDIKKLTDVLGKLIIQDKINQGYKILEIKMSPYIQILAPKASKKEVESYIKKGWLPKEAEHYDRVFPRNYKGNPVLLKHWLYRPLKDACDYLNLNKNDILDFIVLDDEGLPTDAIVIDPDSTEAPVYRRVILDRKKKEEKEEIDKKKKKKDEKNKQTTETYEYIPASYEIKFKVLTKVPEEFKKALIFGGLNTGLMARTGHGLGKFIVTECKEESELSEKSQKDKIQKGRLQS